MFKKQRDQETPNEIINTQTQSISPFPISNPFGGSFNKKLDLNLKTDGRIVVDLARSETEAEEVQHELTWMEERKLDEIKGLVKTKDSSEMRSILNNFRVVKSLYTFEEHRYVYFSDPLNKFTKSFDYNITNEFMLVNNKLNVSCLSFDFANELHHFRVLKGIQRNQSDICSSASFFGKRFNNLVLSTTLNSKVGVFDMEKKKNLFNVDYEGALSSNAWDKLFCIFDNKNKLVLFDVRDPITPITKISCFSGIDMINKGQELMCSDLQKMGNKLLISTNLETFSYDMRESFNKFEGKSPIFTGKRRSFTYFDCKETDINENQNRLNCKTSSFISEGKAVIADFVNTTLDLHDLSSQKIEKSLFFGNGLYDISHSRKLGKIAVLLDNKENEKELAIFNEDLSLDNILSLKGKYYNKLGFIGAEGKLLVHSKNNYEVLNINEKYTRLAKPF